MAQTHRQRFLIELKTNDHEMTALFKRLADQGRGLLIGAAGADGRIRPQASENIRRSMRAAVISMFLVQGSGEPTPFEVINGVVIPLSPFMRILWRHIEGATRIGVQRHADLIERRLAKHQGILFRMKRARGNPFEEARKVRQVLGGTVWRPNPFATYDPAHLWVDPNGYRLSDRIWRNSIDVRRRIDLLIDEGIRDGRSALDIAEDLEAFLIPGRKLRRTDRPYGTDASADAMRLARTEITRAHAQADLMAANMNPFVDTFNVVLSGSHPKTDICDDKAAGGPYPKAEASGDVPPFHPHCLCGIRWNIVENAGLVISDLREEVRKQRSLLLDLVGPALVEEFTKMLMRQLYVFSPPEPLPFP